MGPLLAAIKCKFEGQLQVTACIILNEEYYTAFNMLTDLLHRYVPNARWRNLAGVASKTFHTDFHILAEEDSSEVNFWCGLLYSPFANIRLISLEGCSKQQEFLHQDLAQNGQTSSPASSLLLVKHAYSQFLDGTVGDAPMQVSGGL